MKNSLRIFFGVIIAGLLFYLLTKIDFTDIFLALQTIQPKFFILSFAALSLANVVFVARGMIALRKIVYPHFWFFLETTLAGFFINVITPGSQVGGEPVRAYYLGKRYKKPKTKVFGAVLADRVIHAIASLFFIIASLLFILTYIPVSKELKIIFQTTLLFILAVIAVIAWMNMKKTKFSFRDLLEKLGILSKIKKIKALGDVEKHLGNFTSSFKRTIRDKNILFFGIVFSLLHWVLVYLSSYFLFLSLGVHISFFIVIVVVSLGSLVGEISPTPGGIGIIEGFMVFFYSIVGISLSAAIIVAILSRVIMYFYALFIGGLSLLHLEKMFG